MKRLLAAQLMAVALALLGGAGAQAASMSVDNIQWTYNFTPGAPAITANGNAAAGVTFTNEPTKVAVGNSDIVATNLRVFSAATAASPDVLTNGNYTLTLQLSTVENGTPHSTSMTFTGTLAGKFSAENANLANVFGPNSTQSALLGSYTFTVSLMAYTPPGPPDQQNAGSISAYVSISVPEPSEQTPEPSTMLLSGLGLTMLGGAAWRKRRQARANEAQA